MMKADERRNEILKRLNASAEPVSASALAAAFGVSRQIIVGDIALLRAGGENISSTPRGYLTGDDSRRPQALLRRVACLHDESLMERELQICIDQGCTVLDVIVGHPIYGQLIGQLSLTSRYDIDQFIRKINEEKAHALSELTDGVHLHTLQCPSQAAYERVLEGLSAAGILYTQTD